MADAMKKHLKADRILMSGSGPTIVAYYIDKKQAEKDYQEAILGNWTDSSWKVYITETGKVMV
jgi:4-diphosphocytidyl-2-C-methyl-D-erythritol kinase